MEESSTHCHQFFPSTRAEVSSEGLPSALAAVGKPTHLPVMMLDLTEEETDALARPLRRTIDDSRYPLSPRIQTLKGILAKIRPEPARESLPPPKVYAPPRIGHWRRR